MLISKILLICAFSLSFNNAGATPNKVKAAKLKKDTNSNIYLQGHIVIKNKAVKGTYKIEVMYYNTLAGTYLVKHNESVNLYLKKDSPYVLKISKKGFVPRYICLNTNLQGSRNLMHSFYFETELIETTDAMRLDNEALDLPIGMISYDKTKGAFSNNKDYTQFVTQRLYGGSEMREN